MVWTDEALEAALVLVLLLSVVVVSGEFFVSIVFEGSGEQMFIN